MNVVCTLIYIPNFKKLLIFFSAYEILIMFHLLCFQAKIFSLYLTISATSEPLEPGMHGVQSPPPPKILAGIEAEHSPSKGL